jgi:hypothetical protein
MGIELQSWNAYQVIPEDGIRKLLGVIKTNPGSGAKKIAIEKAMRKWGVHGATIGWHVEVEPLKESAGQRSSMSMRDVIERLESDHGDLQTESMMKVGNEDMAQDFAKERKQSYGMSVFDGKWYVGEVDELKKLGITAIKDAAGKTVWQAKFRHGGREI